ncbi:1236_t:CDS:2 [Dentiscutata heterogama]|uniref:1236_t:CDS:1 n=1 Tax=Dentiscutata heterogama TaxID=1316150 RepID=A0ACA9KIF9_9GLOM|nr:1236_t:CDS:2 [Dentiscutata heterogama]
MEFKWIQNFLLPLTIRPNQLNVLTSASSEFYDHPQQILLSNGIGVERMSIHHQN